MKPNASSYTKGCPDLLPAGCITWNGPNFPSLGIVTNQVLSETVFIIAKKVCAITNSLDLSNLDLSCLIDLCEDCQVDKSLKNVLQLLLDNQCTLKELIDAINGGISETTTLLVNMKCLKKYDEFENEIPQDLNQSLQSIVNQICDNTDAIETLQATVIDLQNQIDDIDVSPTTTEVNVATCIASSRPVSQALVQVANNYCSYKEDVGSTEDIQEAISRQPIGSNALLGAISGWDLSPNSMANSLNNLWLAYSNLLTRVSLMESTCCKPSCDNVKIGFITTFESSTVTLSFTSGAGTSIPIGFEDCGSTLTITSSDGLITTTVNLPIEYNATTDPVDVSIFTPGDVLDFNLSAKLCSEGLNCDKCIFKKVTYSNSGCCVITNDGDSNATIVYQTPLNTPSS